jgi:DNA-binding transcriptional ArsR family regulator
MANDRAGKSRFRGFRSPTYTQVPDELFDELLPELSGAELKVLLYIIRRTFGFKRDRDSISLSQMLNGVQSRSGEMLDRGAGVSKPTLLQALRSLEERGIIETERRRSAEKGDEPTVYTLRFAPDQRSGQKPIRPLVNKLDHGGGQESSPPAWSKNLTTQETVSQQTDFDLSNFEGSHDQVDRGDRPDDARFEHRPVTTSDRLMPLGEILHLRSAAYGGRGGIAGHATAEPHTKPRSVRQGKEIGAPEEREHLRPFLADFARELGDEAPLASTITRVLNIFQTAGVAPERWSDLLYQARGLTQEHTAQIRKLAGDGGSGMRRKNKMPYFLATLEQLVGLRPEAAGPARTS